MDRTALTETASTASSGDDLLDLLATGVVFISPDWHIEAINIAGETLLESSASRIKGEPLDRLVNINDEWLELLTQAQVEDYPMVRREIVMSLHSGHQQTVDVTVSPLPRGPRRALLLELSPVDRLNAISEGENLWQAQASLRQIIKGLAHEVKNPLGGIRGAAQLLARELPSESLSEYTDIIMEEADRLRRLVDQMLGPREKLIMTQLNIHEVIERVRQLIEVESQGNLAFIRDYDPSLPEFRADLGQLTQVLLNIVRNAWQATGNHGVITLKTRARRQFTIGGHRHRLVCAIEVIDNGPGVPDDILPGLFLPMVSSRPNGAGLGLSIAQMIANRHQGLIQCQSEPGHTVFTLLLPMES